MSLDAVARRPTVQATYPDLVGKTVIVTGASSGIGAAIAEAYSQAGANVCGCDVAPRRDESFILAQWRSVDVRDSGAVTAFVGGVVEAHGRVDILVNAAGVGVPSEHFRSTHETEDADWDLVLDVNLSGGFRMARAALPSMLERGGSVVNIASIMALVGNVGTAPYGASKHGIAGLTRVMALEYAKRGVRVNAICPGYVDTPMVARHMEQVDDAQAERALLDSLHPMGRIAQSYEIADAVLWVSSASASFVTGAVIPVDGGYTAA